MSSSMHRHELKTVREEARNLDVIDRADVVVVGGGIAGVAAALAAARNGARTCLLEKFCALGGLATLGNVIIYLPLCDGMGHQVCGGISEELLKLSVIGEETNRNDLRLSGIPECWLNPSATIAERSHHRYQVGFNPTIFMYRLERLLLENGVRIFYDTRFSGVTMKNSRINAVIVESKGGRQAIATNAVVDASGDADVCMAAGEKTISIGGNVRSGWYYYSDNGHLCLRCCSQPFDPIKRIPENGTTFRADSAAAVTAQVIASRQFIMEDIEHLKAAKPDHDIFLVMLPTMPTHRMTRRLAGRVTLKPTDDHREYHDIVGLTGDWRKAGPVYPIPLRALVARHTHNLITAGRCISSRGDTWDVTRVIPTCAVSGEAAGTAAAMLSSTGSFAALNIKDLQSLLIRRGAILNLR